jgi:hypothetical protein
VSATLLLERCQRRDLVVKAGNDDAAVRILHRGEQPRQLQRGIRRPVAVMTAVQLVARTVNRYVEGHDAARAEDQRLLAILEDGAVTNQPDIRREQSLISGESFLQVRRVDLFFAFKRQLDVRFRLQAGSPECIECGEHGDDRRLVVAGAARVQTPLGIEGRAGRRQRNDLAAVFERSVAQRRLKRRRCPLLRIERLPVVMRVEPDSACRTRHAQLRDDHRVAPGYRHRLCGQAARLDHFGDQLGVALDVRLIARDIGNRE